METKEQQPETQKPKQEFILLIMNCYAYRHKAQFQKKTWLKNLPSQIKYYHVIGNPNLETQYVFDDEENILTVKTNDDYVSLPKKVISAYRATFERYDFSYIFKTDDDQFNTTNKFFIKLMETLTNKNNIIHYGGSLINVKTPHYSSYNQIHPELPKGLIIKACRYSSGRFYFLSNNAVIDLLKKQNNINDEYFEDYAIGFHLDMKLKEFMLNILTETYFIDVDNMDDFKASVVSLNQPTYYRIPQNSTSSSSNRVGGVL